MVNPEISVILPFYNAGEHLSEAIESILTQSVADFELLLIDDGSTDNSLAVASSFSDPRIRLIRNDKNSGLIYSLNRGLELSKGNFIARMDADDISLPKRLELQLEVMKQMPDVIVCGTQAEYFGSMTGATKLPVSSDRIKASLIHGPCFVHPSVMFRGSFIRNNNIAYSNAHIHMEDYDLWLRIFPLGQFHNINEPLLRYRVGEQNITRKHKETREARLKHMFGDVLALFKLEPTDKHKQYMLELSFNVEAVASYHELHAFKKQLISNNRHYHVFEPVVFDEIINEQWSRIFYKAADKGFIQSFKYYWASRKISMQNLKYQVGRIARR